MKDKENFCKEAGSWPEWAEKPDRRPYVGRHRVSVHNESETGEWSLSEKLALVIAVLFASAVVMFFILAAVHYRESLSEPYNVCYSRKLEDCRNYWKGLQYECRDAAKAVCRVSGE